jgi:rubrerythrin
MSSQLNAIEVFGVAVKSEIEAAHAYQQMITRVDNVSVKRKLRFLRDEERKHRQLLEERYRHEYPDVKLALPAKGLAPRLNAAIEQGLDLARLFELAMQAERASERFYAEAAAQAQSQSGRRLLSYLSGMERGHYYLLKSEYDLLNEFERFASYKKFSQEHLGA